MKVSELVAKLLTLPQDLPVYHDREGILESVDFAETTDMHVYSKDGAVFEDYYGTDTPDEGEVKFKGVLVQ